MSALRRRPRANSVSSGARLRPDDRALPGREAGAAGGGQRQARGGTAVNRGRVLYPTTAPAPYSSSGIPIQFAGGAAPRPLLGRPPAQSAVLPFLWGADSERLADANDR